MNIVNTRLKKKIIAFSLIFSISFAQPIPSHSFFIWDALKCILAGRQMIKLRKVYKLYKKIKGIQKGIETEINAFKEMEEDWMGYIEDVSEFIDDMSSSTDFVDFANKLLGYANEITADIDREYLSEKESNLLDDVIEKMNNKIEESTKEMKMVLANTGSDGTTNDDNDDSSKTRFTDAERVLRTEAALHEIILAKKKVSDLTQSLKVQIALRKAKGDSKKKYDTFFNVEN